MPGEEVSATLTIVLDGSPLAAPVAALLVGATLDVSLNAPDMFVLRFLDEQASVLERSRAKVGSKVTLTLHQSGQGAPPTLLDEGEVTAVETDVTGAGTFTVIRGFDQSHRLTRGVRYRAFLDTTPADIARSMAGAAGLTSGRIGPFTEKLPQVSQGGVNDWQLLQTMASRVGATVTSSSGKLDFSASTLASTASGPPDARRNPVVLQKGVNLVSVRATLSAGDQVPEVEVRSWNVKQKRAMSAKATAKTGSARVPGADPARWAGTLKAPTWVESQPTLQTPKQCQDMADVLADRIAGTSAELDGLARGNPALRAGVAVRLVGAGTTFDGAYTLSTARHEFSRDRGYLTYFTASNRCDRTAYGLVRAGAGTRSGRWHGPMVGIVTDVKDPEKMSRVKVKLPLLSEQYASPWARLVQVGAGKDRGTAVLPEVNDEVLVVFGMGELDDPFVIGGLYNGMDKPLAGSVPDVNSSSGEIQRRAFVSRTGMEVEFVESSSTETLTVCTNKRAQKIVLTQTADKGIQIVSEGPVTVSAKKDVSVTTSGGKVEIASSSGDLTLKGTKVVIDATSDVEVNGANVKLTAKAAAELSGATAKVAGKAQAELSASGPTSISGAIVKIN